MIEEEAKILHNSIICISLISIIFIITCFILIIGSMKQIETINNILNTKYEICVGEKNNQFCYQRTIKDYLQNNNFG